MFSIDQNSHSLWDTLPKLHALQRHGLAVQHFIEDIDVAFTSLGADIAGSLRIARERFHRSGGADWGAALFYSDFLGKLPVEIRDWEPYTGMKTHVLAKQLGRNIDDLYDEFSPGDNWQLIGPSYIGDHEHHRIIGDLVAAEVSCFLLEILDLARQDAMRAFPEAASRERTTQWFDREFERVCEIIRSNPQGMIDIYRDWLGKHPLPAAARGGPEGRLSLSESSALFGDPARMAVLELFTANYNVAADLYNQAIDETRVQLHPLRKAAGELPFFAIYRHDGHHVRSAVYLDDDALRIVDRSFPLSSGGKIPLAEMEDSGVIALAGKAIVLVLQVRYGPGACPLALPYHGSAYMPAAYRLQQLLAKDGMLSGEVQPIYRVRLRLLDRMQNLQTTIGLPEHLQPYFGRAEIPASDLSANYRQIAQQAAARLESFKDEPGRQQWLEREFPALAGEIAQLEHRRRELATTEPKGQAVRDVWQHVKALKAKSLDCLLRQIARDWQARELDYWDSRGAILPWSLALGGPAFYDDVIRQSEVYIEAESRLDQRTS